MKLVCSVVFASVLVFVCSGYLDPNMMYPHCVCNNTQLRNKASVRQHDVRSLNPMTQYAYNVGLDLLLYTAPMAHYYDLMNRVGHLHGFPYNNSINYFSHQQHLYWYPTDVEHVCWDNQVSSAFLDLFQNALVFNIPETERFFYSTIHDFWGSPSYTISPRVHGQNSHHVIIGPTVRKCFESSHVDWRKIVPKDWFLWELPTDNAWLVIRTEIYGPQDLAACSEWQDTMSLKNLTDAFGGGAVLREILKGCDLQPAAPFEPELPEGAPEAFMMYAIAAESLQNTPLPLPELHNDFVRIGVTPGLGTFDFASLSQAKIDGLVMALEAYGPVVSMAASMIGHYEGAWLVAGRNKSDLEPYMQDRFLLAGKRYFADDAGITDEDSYLFAYYDDNCNMLSTEHKYKMHFVNEPTVDAWWSISSYLFLNGIDTLFNVTSGRYAIGTHQKNDAVIVDGEAYYFTKEQDGSFDIYLQRDPPAGHEGNWIKMPEVDNGWACMYVRILAQHDEVEDGSWPVPTVQRID